MFFVGKPSKDMDSPDYVPSIFVFKGTIRNCHAMNGFWLGKLREKLNMKNMRLALQHIVIVEKQVILSNMSDGVESLSATSTVMVDKGTSCDIQVRDSSVNTDDSYESRQILPATIAEQKEKISSLNDSLLLSSSPAAAMRNDNEQTLFLTGIPSYDMF